MSNACCCEIDAALCLAKRHRLPFERGGHRSGGRLELKPGRDRSRFKPRGLNLLNLANEPKSLARNGADQALLLTAVPHCLAGRVHAAGQSGFRDDPAVPN